MQEINFSDLEEVKRQTITNIAALIRAYCEAHDITLKEFAATAGVSMRAVQEILNEGKGYRKPNPTLKTLQGVYKVLGVEDWLGGKLD